MLQRVPLIPRSLDEYRGIVGTAVVDEVRVLAGPVRGARVAQVNATAYGGGVSELLHSLIPLHLGLDIAADWLVIPAATSFPASPNASTMRFRARESSCPSASATPTWNTTG